MSLSGKIRAQFLIEKLRLLSPYLEPQFAEQMRALFEKTLSDSEKLPAQVFTGTDGELERRMRMYMTDNQIHALRAELVQRFGQARLGPLNSEDEARLILERLADQDAPLDVAEREKLSKRLAKFRR